MVVSANERFATKVAAFVHTIINAEDAVSREPVPWAELRARPDQRNSMLEFDVGPASPSKDPSVFAVGIGGQMTGGRADLIISDDVEVPNNSETEAQREKLEDRTGEYAAILKPGGEVVYLGTFQSMQSIYRRLKAEGLHPAPLAGALPQAGQAPPLRGHPGPHAPRGHGEGPWAVEGYRLHAGGCPNGP
jgi:hypothetical protein